jgi:hypothetical protein
VFPSKPPETAAERRPRDPGVVGHPAGNGEAEQLGLVVEFAEADAGFDTGATLGRVDVDAVHPREVDD